jgi:hypothetical protein
MAPNRTVRFGHAPELTAKQLAACSTLQVGEQRCFWAISDFPIHPLDLSHRLPRKHPSDARPVVVAAVRLTLVRDLKSGSRSTESDDGRDRPPSEVSEAMASGSIRLTGFPDIQVEARSLGRMSEISDRAKELPPIADSPSRFQITRRLGQDAAHLGGRLHKAGIVALMQHAERDKTEEQSNTSAADPKQQLRACPHELTLFRRRAPASLSAASATYSGRNSFKTLFNGRNPPASSWTRKEPSALNIRSRTASGGRAVKCLCRAPRSGRPGDACPCTVVNPLGWHPDVAASIPRL